jgi:hypothetical protein
MKCETQTINNTPIVHALASSFKMAKNTSKKTILVANEVRQHAPPHGALAFFPFGGGWGCWIFVVSNVFP